MMIHTVTIMHAMQSGGVILFNAAMMINAVTIFQWDIYDQCRDDNVWDKCSDYFTCSDNDTCGLDDK